MCRSSQELNSPGTDSSMIAPVFETVLSSLTQVSMGLTPHAAQGGLESYPHASTAPPPVYVRQT